MKRLLLLLLPVLLALALAIPCKSALAPEGTGSPGNAASASVPKADTGSDTTFGEEPGSAEANVEEEPDNAEAADKEEPDNAEAADKEEPDSSGPAAGEIPDSIAEELPGESAEDLIDGALEEQLDASGARSLYEDHTPQETQDLLGELGVEGMDYKTLLSLSPGDFFSALWTIVCDAARQPLVILASITGVAVLCAMVSGLKTSVGGSGLETVFGVAAVLCICTVVIGPVVECVRLAAEAIRSCSEFIMAFIPVFVSLVAVGGQPVSATTYNGMMLFLSQIISTITAGTLVPLICIYLAFCLVGALTPESNLDGAAKTAKSVVTWGLGLLVTVFVGMLGVQSLVAAGADSVSMKAGKFLVSSFVPVVGKALSDALSTAQSCVRLLRTTVGAYAVVASVMIFLPVLAKTALWYCATGLGAAVCDVLDAQRISKVLRACGAALSLLLGILAFVALLFIISTTVMLITGTGVGT